jgi:hypothetical protein
MKVPHAESARETKAARQLQGDKRCHKSIQSFMIGLPLFEIALVLVRLDHVASVIVNADHIIM